MRVIFDARALRLYPVGRAPLGSLGGTENYLRVIAHGLARKGYQVHVVCSDLEHEEQRDSNEWWWGPGAFPTNADVVVQVHNLEGITTSAFNAPILLCMTNGVDPWGPAELIPNVDGWPVFSECHRDLLCKTRGVDPEKCFVTGLGVETVYEGDYLKIPGRLLFANDPARGLWHTLDIFDKLRELVPDASLHVAYDFDKQFEAHRWNATALSEKLWDCKRRLASTPGVKNLGALSRADLIREQLECQVHVMPSDPPNVGSQIHGITQMECAAAGAALVLSDTEAFPEVFGEAAAILPLPGTYLPDHQRRFDSQDWAETIADLMQDPEAWAEASRKARALAETNTWDHVLDRWDKMLERLALGSLKELAVATAGD